MGYIEIADFKIRRDNDARVGQCLVTGTVRFNRYDRALLREGLPYSLTCVLWGADQYLIEHPGEYPDPILVRAPRHDDRLLEIGKQPIAGERESYPFTFEKNVSFDVLDEDKETRERQPDGTVYFVDEADELYATVTLESSVTRLLRAQTHRLRRNFGR
jgi:hypothetical protein